MLPSKPHDVRVVYVARSAREFPESVQEWLSQANNRAIASSNVYDALARLTGRRRPVAIIVSIESVDWEELDFFDLAALLSRETSIYVAGREHDQAKIEAALSRGARLFSAEELTQDLSRPAPGPHPPTTRDLLAGTLRKGPEGTGPPAGGGPEWAPRAPAASAASPPARSRASEPARTQQPGPESVGPPEAAIEEQVTPPPAVRLVTPSEADVDLEPPADLEPSIPFPWAPSPNRPRRTPPAATGEPAAAGRDAREGQTDSESEASGQKQQPEPSAHHPTPPAVELTAEELAALMGKPVPPRSASEQEQR